MRREREGRHVHPSVPRCCFHCHRSVAQETRGEVSTEEERSVLQLQFCPVSYSTRRYTCFKARSALWFVCLPMNACGRRYASLCEEVDGPRAYFTLAIATLAITIILIDMYSAYLSHRVELPRPQPRDRVQPPCPWQGQNSHGGSESMEVEAHQLADHGRTASRLRRRRLPFKKLARAADAPHGREAGSDRAPCVLCCSLRGSPPTIGRRSRANA